MPLRAYIEDKEIVSIDLNDEEWSALKARLKAKEIVLTLPCCGQEGFLRTSNRGLKHFVHLKSANPCDWKPESAEHLKAKVAIMEACRAQCRSGLFRVFIGQTLSGFGFAPLRIVCSTTPRRHRQAFDTSLRKVVHDAVSVCGRVNHNRRISIIVFYIQWIFRSGNLISNIFLIGRIV